VLWELPCLDKGVWKTEKNPVEAAYWLAKPAYVTQAKKLSILSSAGGGL